MEMTARLKRVKRNWTWDSMTLNSSSCLLANKSPPGRITSETWTPQWLPCIVPTVPLSGAGGGNHSNEPVLRRTLYFLIKIASESDASSENELLLSWRKTCCAMVCTILLCICVYFYSCGRNCMYCLLWRVGGVNVCVRVHVSLNSC